MRGVVLPEMVDYTGTYPLAMGELLLDKNVHEYDDVNKGDEPVQEIHIFNNGEKTMRPNVMHLPPYLSATVKPETLAPGKGGTVSVTLNSDKLRDFGLTKTSVYLAKQLGEKVSQDNEIPVSTVLLPHLQDYDEFSKALAPQLQISTTEIDFSNFEGKTKKTAEVILYNTGKTTLKISSLQLFTTGLKVTLDKQSLEPDETASLKITGFAEELKNLRSKPRILMITNAPDRAKVVININL
jgi:archaellum component FlaF (FlaF/FlaG flagellin family)